MLVGLDFEFATFISPEDATPQTTHVVNDEAVKKAIFTMDTVQFFPFTLPFYLIVL
jgi:hypothetical protein